MTLSCSGLASLLLFAAFESQQVSGHGYLVQPLAKFISVNIDKTQYSSTIDSYKLFPNGTFNTDPTINVESFVENYKKSSYKSVRAMIEDNQVLVSNDATATCGFSDPAQTSYGALNDTVYWGRNDDLTLDEGFVHMGPCEVWCDDKRAQQDMNCQVTYTPASGKGAAPVPIDSSVCTDAKRLSIYWVAMHGATWQVYINCVNINGGTGGTETGSSPASTTTTTTNVPTTIAPTPTTSVPTTLAPTPTTAATTDSNGEETASESDNVATSAPSTTTATPSSTPSTEDSSIAGEASTTTSKCSTRRRIRS